VKIQADWSNLNQSGGVVLGVSMHCHHTHMCVCTALIIAHFNADEYKDDGNIYLMLSEIAQK